MEIFDQVDRQIYRPEDESDVTGIYVCACNRNSFMNLMLLCE